MMQHKLLTTSILALGLAGAAQAAELGDIAPRSYIGQPLAVDIELVALTPEEVAGLQARLAAADVYRGANVTMNPALSTVRMAVERRGQKSVLHVTTTRAVEADYLHVYVELGVPGKQDVRLATVWLQRDPNPPPPPAPVVVAAVTPPMPPASAMTPAQAEQITAQARAARAAAADAAKPAVAAAPTPAPAPERAKPAPLPSVHEAETGKPGEVKAAAGQARRIAGVLVGGDGKPLKPSDREESAEVPVSVAQALLPLAPLPLPKGVKRPAPTSCAPNGMSAKECVALDARNTEMASKLTELESKLKALQGALGGAAAPAGPVASAAAGKGGGPAANAAAPAQTAKGGAQVASATASAAAQADAVKAAVKSGAATAGGASSAAAGNAASSAPQKAGAKTAAAGAANSAGGASSAGSEAGGKDGGKDGHGGKDASSLASASMSAQGETEAHAAKAAASGEASASAPASTAAASASAAASVPTKQVRVLPKLKYKKEKEKPAESSSTIPLIAGGVGLLALLGGGFVFWRKRSAGSGPLKIWQGFRKKKPEEPAPDAAAPVAESAPESVA